jgi:hypothetical protein
MSVVATDEDTINKDLREQAGAIWLEIQDQAKRCSAQDHLQRKYLQGWLDCCSIFAFKSTKSSEFRVLQKLVKSKEQKGGEKKLPPKVYEEPKPKSVKKKK